jgi:hypothetical protein
MTELPYPYCKPAHSHSTSMLLATAYTRSPRQARNLKRVIGYLLHSGYVEETTLAPNERARLRYPRESMGQAPGLLILYRSGAAWWEGSQSLRMPGLLKQIGGVR